MRNRIIIIFILCVTILTNMNNVIAYKKDNVLKGKIVSDTYRIDPRELMMEIEYNDIIEKGVNWSKIEVREVESNELIKIKNIKIKKRKLVVKRCIENYFEKKGVIKFGKHYIVTIPAKALKTNDGKVNKREKYRFSTASYECELIEIRHNDKLAKEVLEVGTKVRDESFSGLIKLVGWYFSGSCAKKNPDVYKFKVNKKSTWCAEKEYIYDGKTHYDYKYKIINSKGKVVNKWRKVQSKSRKYIRKYDAITLKPGIYKFKICVKKNKKIGDYNIVFGAFNYKWNGAFCVNC